MKTFILTLLICVGIMVGHAQTITAYKAILETKTGKHKGILQKVDTANIILNVDGRFEAVKLADIQSVKIRRTKKRYNGKNYMAGSSPTEYHVDSDGEMVDEFGNEMPSLGEEVTASVVSVFFNGLLNLIAFPFYAINPNIAKFNFEEKKDAEQLEQLNYYSIHYQGSPSARVTDLKKIKEISEKARQ
jgi:hypothetical protein